MLEDKLTHDERLRLECLAQSIARSQHQPSASPEHIIKVAQVFEEYVKDRRTKVVNY